MMDSCLPFLYEREKIPNITNHGKPRDAVIYEILKVHDKFYKYVGSKISLDTPTWEMIQLAILYADVYLTHNDSIDAKLLANSCYTLSYKYESDDNIWEMTSYVEIKEGRSFMLKTAKIEKIILENLNYRANLTTPLEFISEFIYDATLEGHKVSDAVRSNAQLMSIYIMASSDILSKDTSKIAIISLMLVDDCLNKYFSTMHGFMVLLAHKHSLQEVIENDWEDFTAKYNVSEMFDYDSNSRINI